MITLTQNLFNILIGDQVQMIIWLLLFVFVFLRYAALRSKVIRVKHSKIDIGNLFYTAYIFLCACLGSKILAAWLDNTNLTIYENYIAFLVAIMLLSGVVAYFFYRYYFNHPDAFIIKNDENIKKQQSESDSKQKEIANSRIARITNILDIVKSKKDIKPQGSLPVDSKELDELAALFPAAQITGSFFNKYSNTYTIYKLPDASWLVYNSTISRRITSVDFNHSSRLYNVKKDKAEEFILYNSSEIPTFTSNKFFYKNSIPESAVELLNSFRTNEENIKIRIDDHTNQRLNINITLGFMWYYVLLIILGNKIDYIIPSSFKARSFVLFFISLRFFILSCVLSIIINGIVKH